ncbi:hypothetical protein D9M72_585390 [compost metagenome]
MAVRKVSASGRRAIRCAVSSFRSRTDSFSSALQKSRQYHCNWPALRSNNGCNSISAMARLTPCNSA